MSTSDAMILVIGGASKIGSALIEELLERGQHVRALTRAGENHAFAPAVDVALGDLGDPASLVAAMRNVAKLFLLCGPTPDEVAFNDNALAAAQRAGIHFVVRSSILGADSSSPSTFHRDHGVCDEHLRSAGLAYAIVRPNMFMQNVPESTIPSIGPDGVFYANAGEARISMVDTRDVAAVAAALLTAPAPHDTELDVTGPEALSYTDVAQKLSASMGRQITYVNAPDDAVRGALAAFGLSEWMVGALVELFQDYRRSGADGYAARVSDTVERLTGRRPRSLDDMLAQGAAS